MQSLVTRISWIGVCMQWHGVAIGVVLVTACIGDHTIVMCRARKQKPRVIPRQVVSSYTCLHTCCPDTQPLVAKAYLCPLPHEQSQICTWIFLSTLKEYIKGVHFFFLNKSPCLQYHFFLCMFTGSADDSSPTGTSAVFKVSRDLMSVLFSVVGFEATEWMLLLPFTYEKLQHRKPFRKATSKPVFQPQSGCFK